MAKEDQVVEEKEARALSLAGSFCLAVAELQLVRSATILFEFQMAG